MINVVDTYNSVRDLCNKDQKGFVTPEVFTVFAGIAQQNVFNEMFSELAVAKKMRRNNIDPARDKSMYKQVEEDLAYFIREETLDITGNQDGYDPADISMSVFDKPSDLSKIISMRTTNSGSQAQVELIYNAEDIDRIIRSNLSTPTAEFPVALISNNIQIFPEETDAVRIMYYRQPRSINARNGQIDFNSTPVYQDLSFTGSSVIAPDIVNCRHFELPEHYKNEVIIEIAKMVGISLRDSFLSTITLQEEKAE